MSNFKPWKLRFAIAESNVQYSSIWGVNATDSGVYVFSPSMGGRIKASFHTGGNFKMAPQGYNGSNRDLYIKWRRAPDSDNDITAGMANLSFPTDLLAPSASSLKPNYVAIRRAPPQHAVFVTMGYTRLQSVEWNRRCDSNVLAYRPLADPFGNFIALCYYSPWTLTLPFNVNYPGGGVLHMCMINRPHDGDWLEVIDLRTAGPSLGDGQDSRA